MSEAIETAKQYIADENCKEALKLAKKRHGKDDITDYLTILDLLIDAIKYSIERTPPELIQDIRKSGIMLAGGGAKLDGFKELLEEQMGMPVKLAEDPVNSMIRGINIVLNNIDKYDKVVF